MKRIRFMCVRPEGRKGGGDMGERKAVIRASSRQERLVHGQNKLES